MINKPPPFKGANIRISIIIPIKRRGFINHGSTLIRVVLRGQSIALEVKALAGLGFGA